MTPHVFLNRSHWIALMEALSNAGWYDTPTGALGELRRLFADADKHKRFIIEVENHDLGVNR